MTGTPPPKAGTKLTLILCFCLMVVYMAQGLMITASKNASGSYDYDKNASVMLSEICKFIISATILMYQSAKRSPDAKPLTSPIGADSLKYAVPGVLYAAHNNIIFIALELLSPVTYQLFNNIKIVTTGLVFRIFLSRPLRLNQWMAIVLLPLSMCVTQLGNDDDTDSQTSKIFQGFLWMLVLSSCSAFAGVYNEFLLKKGAAESSLMWKNMQLYFFGTLACAVSYHHSKIVAIGEGGAEAHKGLLHGFGPLAWGVVLLNGVLGQIISAIFLYADNIVKVYAASGAVLLTPFISRCFFDTPLHAPLFVGIGVALISLFMYFLPTEHLVATDIELAEMLNCSPSLKGSRRLVSKDDRQTFVEEQNSENSTPKRHLVQRMPAKTPPV